MISELLNAGPVFWVIVVLIALGSFGYTKEKLRKRKLEIDMQKKLNRDLQDMPKKDVIPALMRVAH